MIDCFYKWMACLFTASESIVTMHGMLKEFPGRLCVTCAKVISWKDILFLSVKFSSCFTKSLNTPPSPPSLSSHPIIPLSSLSLPIYFTTCHHLSSVFLLQPPSLFLAFSHFLFPLFLLLSLSLSITVPITVLYFITITSYPLLCPSFYLCLLSFPPFSAHVINIVKFEAWGCTLDNKSKLGLLLNMR